MAMKETLKHLEAHRRWLEVFNKPLVIVRQELFGLVHDDRTVD